MTKILNDLWQPSRKLTFEDAVQIHILHDRGAIQHRLAAHFEVNPARIAEVLRGDLHPGSREEATRRTKGA